jgi:NAD(P)-dependent dehydrogenase (short-subunit alcohol dehydrogenase family)
MKTSGCVKVGASLVGAFGYTDGFGFFPLSSNSVKLRGLPQHRWSIAMHVTDNNDNLKIPSDSSDTIPWFSRRNFFSAITASNTAISLMTITLATTTTPTANDYALAASLPTGVDLVQPNSLYGQMMVITGGTTGLGLESAKALATGGATVVITARTDAKGRAAVDAIQSYLHDRGIRNDNVSYVQLDLDDLENVKMFPQRFVAKYGDRQRIDVLMNNAGVMAIPELQLTKDGYERTFQTNHLGQFVLTAKLIPLLKEQGARVISVSSQAYQIAGKGLDLSNLNGEKGYSAWGSYGASKLENILFTQELQRRADASGFNLVATSLHPGAVNTDLARNMMGGEEEWYKKKVVGPTNFGEKVLQTLVNKALLTPEQGAATQVYLAIAKDEERGRFYSDLKPQTLPAFATDESVAEALWNKSEELCGVQFPFDNR